MCMAAAYRDRRRQSPLLSVASRGELVDHAERASVKSRSDWDWRERGRRVDEARAPAAAAFQAFKQGGRTDEKRRAWEICCRARDDAWQAAWPPTFWDAFQALGTPGPCDVSMFVDFLEADPVFFRSGYVGESILRRLRRHPLTEPVKERLRHVVVDAVRRRHRREFRRFSSLARDLDTPVLRLQLEELARGSDARVRRHATWVLESLAQAERMRRWFVSL